MNSYKPVFVVGCQRSGTTLLRLMLNKHSMLSIPEESHFIIDIFKEFQDVSHEYEISELDRETLFRVIVGVPRFATWNLADDVVRAIVFSSKNKTIPDVINALFELKTSCDNNCIWGDKTPEYTMYLNKIHDMFPSAIYIHIVRDGRDVVDSFKAAKWYGWSIYQRTRHWMQYTSTAESFGQFIGRKNFICIRYEDLVLDTANTLEKICNFIGILYEEGMLSYVDGVDAEITQREKESGVHRKLYRLPKESDVYKWQKSWSKLSLFQFESIARYNLSSLGYKVSFSEDSWFFNVAGYFMRIWGVCISLIYNLYHFSGISFAEQNRLANRLKKIIYK